MTKLAIYAGSFDPMTFGHLDLVTRCSELYERLIVAVSHSAHKQPLFPAVERQAMIEAVVRRLQLDNVEVAVFDGLLVDYARARKSRVLIRGLRAYSDFEFEFQMALTNRKLAEEVETLFMMPKENHSYVSSSTVKEVASLGGAVTAFVPPEVEAALQARFQKKEAP